MGVRVGKLTHLCEVSLKGATILHIEVGVPSRYMSIKSFHSNAKVVTETIMSTTVSV